MKINSKAIRLISQRISTTSSLMKESNKPKVVIEYCSQCRFILRASWMLQELLFTFSEDLAEVALRPGSGGVFRVSLNGEVLYDREEQGRFPESKELKQLIRDRIDPERSLGHSDR